MPKETKSAPAVAGKRRPGTTAYAKPELRKGPRLEAIVAVIPPGSGSICWVARAAFGADDFRWMIFRAWLVEDAPGWFRSLYIRRGEAVGRWVAPRPRVRAAIRAAMGPAIRRKLAS